jgi:type I restriction enzyme R subunit
MFRNEPFSRVLIDAQLREAGWSLTDGKSVRYEYVLPDGTRADYLLADRNGRGLAVVEAKRASVSPAEAEGQAFGYAKLAGVPFIFLANGLDVWFWEHEREAHPRQIADFYDQADLERRVATRALRVDPLTLPVDRRIVERDYQTECIDTLCREINLGRRKLLVEMATGTGKTRMAAAFIKRLFQANAITRVLFLVDRITLANQTEDAFAEHLKDYPAYVLRAGRRFQDEKRITITTLQSMINIYRDYSPGYFDLVISDECHRSIYGKWSGVLKHFDGIQLGLTATPCVVSQAVLDSLPDEEDRLFVRDTLRFFEVDKPTYRYPLKQAIAEGYLVPYKIYKAKTVKTAAEGGFDVRRDELDWSAMDEATKREFEKLFGQDDTITVDPNSLERKFTIPERNRAIVREFCEVLEKGFTGADGVRRFAADGKTIVFAVTKRHAETLAQMFDAAFADRKPAPNVRYADFVVSDTTGGSEDLPDAAMRLKRFIKEPFPKIMVSVNMLDTGFDFPEVVNLVMARFTKSAILYQQMRGRGTRRADHIKKQDFTIFDFVGVTDFHGDDEETPEGGFVIHYPPTDGPNQPRKLLVLDVHDHIDPTTRGWVTLDEDGKEMRTEAGEARANDLGVRFEEWLLSRRHLTGDQRRLLRMVGEQIRANALAMESFGAERFTEPPFSLNGGLDRAIQVFGGYSALETMLDGLNSTVFVSEGDNRNSPQRSVPAV